MSFLYDDEVFAQLLINSGIMSELTKQAQDAVDQSDIDLKSLVAQLVDNIQSHTAGQQPDIYVRDLVDMPAFLNMLLKSGQKTSDGKSIVIRQDVGTPEEFAATFTPENKALYKPLTGDAVGFWVHVNGLQAKLAELDTLSKQAGNELMIPLVQNLVQQSKVDGINVPQTTTEMPPNPYETSGDVSGKNPTDKSTSKTPYKNVSYTPEQQAESDAIATVSSIQVPFLKPNEISPEKMNNFIHDVGEILNHTPQLGAGRMQQQFAQLDQAISAQYYQWRAFTSAANAPAAAEAIPYDRNQRPSEMLKNIFHNPTLAREAVRHLSDMITLTIQALSNINNSHSPLENKLGESRITTALANANAYLGSLNSSTAYLQ